MGKHFACPTRGSFQAMHATRTSFFCLARLCLARVLAVMKRKGAHEIGLLGAVLVPNLDSLPLSTACLTMAGT